MADQAPIIRYVGDDWTVGPVTLSSGGRPVDLTGCTVTGLFYAAWAADAAAILTEGGGITVAADRTAGVVSEVWVPDTVTADVKPQDRRATNYPTRTALVVTDSRGRARTYLLILYLPLDRRSDVPPAA